MAVARRRGLSRAARRGRLAALCCLLPLAVAQEEDRARGNPECWTSGFTWKQCCNTLYGRRGNGMCWDAHTHNFESCCRGDVFEPKGCAEFVANFDFSLMRMAEGTWETCVEAMEQRPDLCNAANTSERSCPQCALLSPHFATYIGCVRERQTKTVRADGRAAGGDAAQPSVGGWHYPTLFIPRLEGRDFAVAAPAFDAYVGNQLKVDGQWMYHEVKLLSHLALPGDVVVDAGANIGGFALPLAKRVGRSGVVHAFEPFRLLFQCLNANVMLNGLSNVHTYQAGLGNLTETVKLRQPNLNAVSNPSKMHVAAEVASELMVLTDATQMAEPVRVVRLDDIDFSLGGPSVIKVDVESMEMPMLQGAEKTLRRYRPVLYVEDSEEAPAGTETQMVRHLLARGYKVVDLERIGFHDATSILFFPEEKEEEMMRRVEGINWGVV